MDSANLATGRIRAFLDANARLSRRTQRLLGVRTDKTLWHSFDRELQDRIRALSDGATVVDLGAGRRCVYHHALRPEIRLIAIDSSAEELALNENASERVVADVCTGLPLPDGIADLVISRAVLEHVPDVAAAAGNIARVLAPGGVTMHLLPARYSLFGIAARMLPFKPLLWLLHRVSPSTVGQVEFEVYYDRGWPDALEAALLAAGLREVNIEVTWAQAGYFEPIYPLFLLCALYQGTVRALGVRRLAAYMVVRARR